MSFSTAAGANYWQANVASPWVQSGRPFTAMAWANLASAATAFSCIASTYDGTANGWEFGARGGTAQTVETTGEWYFTWSTGGVFQGDFSNPAHGASAGNVLSASQWYHLCVRYGIDGVSQFDKVQDGIVIATGSTGATAIGASPRKLRIHQSSDNAGVGNPGRSACVRMFEGCLTLQEVNRNRTFVRCPPELRSRCIVDLPGIGRTDAAIPYDLGPKNLGAFAKTGTVTTAFDPPTFTVAETWVQRLREALGAADADTLAAQCWC